jgi:hypothetical protein
MRLQFVYSVQMTKRRTKSTSFFCHPEELRTILEPVLVTSGARLCLADKKDDRYSFRPALSNEVSETGYSKFYPCYPEMLETAGFESLANVVQIWFPALTTNSLRMGEIAILVDESELNGEMRKRQDNIYSAVRKALTKCFRPGALGRNSKTGGEHFYGDILISDWATRAYTAGTVLATQMGDGFVTYHVQ